MTDLKETLCGIAKAIVDDPDSVTVSETINGNKVSLVLNVAEDDMGMVIGKNGKIASFGRAKAKVNSDDKKKVLFKDVAGADEEKSQVSDILYCNDIGHNSCPMVPFQQHKRGR